ncbi:MAG: hypothetical protein ACREIC_19070 [Limisphaerales bacterium]
MKLPRAWKVVIAVVLVFGAGLVSGAVLSFVHFKHAFEHGFTVENWDAVTMQFLQKELKLTPKQQPKVRAIVHATDEQFGKTFGQAILVSGTNMVASWSRIDKVLTPDQQVIYRRKCQDFRTMLKEKLKIDLPRDVSPQDHH